MMSLPMSDAINEVVNGDIQILVEGENYAEFRNRDNDEAFKVVQQEDGTWVVWSWENAQDFGDGDPANWRTVAGTLEAALTGGGTTVAVSGMADAMDPARPVQQGTDEYRNEGR